MFEVDSESGIIACNLKDPVDIKIAPGILLEYSDLKEIIATDDDTGEKFIPNNNPLEVFKDPRSDMM